MEIIHVFVNLVIILLSAKLLAEIFAWLKLPSVLGEVIAGLLLGPSILGIVQVDGTLFILSEIGILLLLFEVGLETDVMQLISVGKQSVLVAVTGVIAPAIFAYLACVYFFGFSFIVSVFVGGTLIATSIGISLRVLKEVKKHQTQTAKIVLGAAVMDDIAGVLILTVLFDLAVKQRVDFIGTATVLGYIVAFLMLAPLAASMLVPWMGKAKVFGRTHGIIPTFVISLILLLSVIAHKIGAPTILGAFAAGIALSRHFYVPILRRPINIPSLAEQIEFQMKPIIDLFVPVFFFVVGASINMRAIDFSSASFWTLAGSLIVLAVVGKVLSGVWVRGSFADKLFCGFAMVPRGEVGLIFAEIGKKSGILDEAMYAVMVFVVALTTLIAPIALRAIAKDISND